MQIPHYTNIELGPAANSAAFWCTLEQFRRNREGMIFLSSLLIFRHFANQLMHEIIRLSDEKRSAAWIAERKSPSHKNEAAVYMHMFDMAFKPRSVLISCSDNPEINPGTLLCHEFVYMRPCILSL